MKNLLMIMCLMFLYNCGDSLVAHNNKLVIDSYGIPGATIQDMMDSFIKLDQYSTVFLLIGINNLASYQTPEDVFLEMVQLKALIGNKNIYIISLLPLNNNIKAFPTNNLVVKTNFLFQKLGNYINVHDIILKIPNIYLKDGIHLNDKGYSFLNTSINQYLENDNN